MPASPKISLRGLTLDFPGGDGTRLAVLRGIDLDVPPGEFVCLVGPSGCGKSTLLNVVAGFLRPTAGEVLIDGRPVVGPDVRRIFIFQEAAVFPWLTVAENVGFGLLDRTAEERAAIVRRYLDMIGLSAFAQAYPHELSGGMKQRVELARALAANPDVLYMDEPLGALDYLTRLRMRSEIIRIWQQERKTILFVTHDVEEAVQLADRIVVLTDRPSTIRQVLEVPLPRPRDPDSPAYQQLRDTIFATLGLDHWGATAAPDQNPNGR